MRKKLYAALLAVCVAVTSVPQTVFAQGVTDTGAVSEDKAAGEEISDIDTKEAVKPSEDGKTEEAQKTEAEKTEEAQKSEAEKTEEAQKSEAEKSEKAQKSETEKSEDAEDRELKAKKTQKPENKKEKETLKLEEKKTEETKETSEQSKVNANNTDGYIPVAFDLPEIPMAKKDGPVCYKASMPSAYDGRSRLGTARNQSPYETCWAFAAMASAEAGMVSRGLASPSIDLSEYQLARFFYNNVNDPLGNTGGDKTIAMNGGVDLPEGPSYLQRGGNNMFATWSMAGWKAGAAEATAPYASIASTNGRLPDSVAFNDIAHLQNAYWLPLANEPQSKMLIKQMIMQYGVVATGYMHDESYMNYAANAYYNNSYSGGGHAIAIVGWDDNFSKTNFKKGCQPANNGAWLVRNSWGSDWGDRGYFWMSYEDASLDSIATVFLFENANNYDYNYQYDGSCGAQALTSESSVDFANVFKVAGSRTQSLEAVSIGMYSAFTPYSIQIYMDPKPGDPTSGKPMLLKPQTGTTTYTGYHTIKLNQPVAVKPGHSFAVVFTLPKGGSVFVDRSYQNADWIRFVNSTASNQSFARISGNNMDLSDEHAVSARIKAFTNVYSGAGNYVTKVYKANASNKKDGKISYQLDGKEYASTPIYAPSKMVLSKETYIYNAKTQRPSVKVYDKKGKRISSAHYTVSYSNKSSKRPGTYSVTVKFKGNSYTGSMKKTYRIAVSSVKGLKATSKSTSSIKLSWKKQSKAHGYYLYAATSKNGKYKKIKTITKNSTTSYTYSKLKSGKTYYFKIKAYKTISKKKYSSSSSSAVYTATKPKTVSGLKAYSVKKTSLKLKWKKVSGASGYYVYRYNSSKKKYVRIATIKKGSVVKYTDKSLKKNKTYKYKVKAYRNVGKSYVAGGTSKVKSVKTKR